MGYVLVTAKCQPLISLTFLINRKRKMIRVLLSLFAYRFSSWKMADIMGRCYLIQIPRAKKWCNVNVNTKNKSINLTKAKSIRKLNDYRETFPKLICSV